MVNDNIIAVAGGRFPNVVTEKADLRESKTAGIKLSSQPYLPGSISMALIGGFE